MGESRAFTSIVLRKRHCYGGYSLCQIQYTRNKTAVIGWKGVGVRVKGITILVASDAYLMHNVLVRLQMYGGGDLVASFRVRWHIDEL